MPYMKHHETSWIIENHYELSVTISSHYHESLFGEIWQVWHVWSSHRDYVSMSRLVFYLHDFIKKTIAVCSNPKDSPWSPTSPIHATSHAVSGLKCLVSKDTNSWSTQGVSVASSSQIAQVTGESGSTGSTAGKYSLYLVVLNWAKPRCSWTKMSELGGKQKEENEQTDKSSLIYLVMLRYYS